MFIGDFKGTASLRLVLHLLLDLHGLSHLFGLIFFVKFIIFLIVNIFFLGDRRWTRPSAFWFIDLCDQFFYLF